MPRDFPDIRDLLPQQGPAILLERVVSFTENEIECETVAGIGAPAFDRGGRVETAVALEWMAQAAAAFAGTASYSKGHPAKPGIITTVRRLRFAVPFFKVGQRVAIQARLETEAEKVSSFYCRVLDRDSREELASGSLTVYLPDQLQAEQQ